MGGGGAASGLGNGDICTGNQVADERYEQVENGEVQFRVLAAYLQEKPNAN